MNQCTHERVASSSSSTSSHAGGVGPVDALGLVEPVDRLGQRVVVAVGDGADRWSCADLVEAFGEAHGRELRPGIGMCTSPTSRRPPRERRAISSASRTISVFMFDRNAPPDDPPGERVDDEAHIGHARPGRHVGEIRDPERVRCCRGEVAVHQIRSPPHVRIGTGGEHLLPLTADTCDAQLAHQPGDLVAADVMTRPAGRPSRASAPRRPCGSRPTTRTAIGINHASRNARADGACSRRFAA